MKSANLILKDYEIFYNYVRKNQAINKCPYKLAIPKLAERLKDVKINGFFDTDE